MRLLLDSCTFLWIISADECLSEAARESFLDPGNTVLLSPLSVWELSLKQALGKLRLPKDHARFLHEQRAQHHITALPLVEEAIAHLHKLPNLHRDPFDRMLVCQAIEHECVILTPDEQIQRYPVRTEW